MLVDLDDLDQVLALHARLIEDPPAGVVDIVPAARTLLVHLDPAVTDPHALARSIRRVPVDPIPASDAEVVEVPVTYDGQDLDEVGERTGLGVAGVVAAHTGQRWTVGFAGFAPGFGYLVGEDERLRVPRRDAPRSSVPAGAVALADVYSGVYPRTSPGGWQLIGRTDVNVWDLARDPPALLRPGVRVQFVDTS